MSFDETFNYSPVVAGLREEKAAVETTLAGLTAERNVLDAATEYAADVDVINRKIRLSIESDIVTTQLNNINSVLAEIAEVQALSESKKADLYYFYTIVETTKQDFMAKILFNHDRALNDEKIAKLRSDTTTPPATRVIIAKLYYSNYIIMQSVIGHVMFIYRYVQ